MSRSVSTKPPRAFSYIRFSSAGQAQGDSLRRQTDKSIEWCDRNNVQLDETLTFQDLGVSGFTGAHLKEGAALAHFLSMVQEGKIPKGSYLLIEDMDRLSRLPLMQALDLFRGIIESGIIIVTLGDNQQHDRKSLDNLSGLLIPLVSMQKAHESSQRTSERVKSAWSQKRTKLSTDIFTSICPAWIKSEDGAFKPINEKVDTLKMIFQLALDGLSALMICKKLNHDQVPVLSPGKRWYESSLKRLLKDRRVIGEFQPHVRETRTKRVPSGDPIPNYYPAVISEDMFHRLQAQYTRRKRTISKTGEAYPNLFARFIFCHCGSKITRIPSGKYKGAFRYATVVCEDARVGKGCKHRSWNYTDLETKLLLFINDKIRLDDLTKQNETQETGALMGEIAFVEQSMNQIDIRTKNWEDSIADYQGANARQYNQRMQARIDAALAEKETLTKRHYDLTRKVDELTKIQIDPAKHLASMKELIQCMQQDPTGEERNNLRRRLRGMLFEMIERITLYPEQKTLSIYFKSGKVRTMFGPEVKADWVRETFGDQPFHVDDWDDQLTISIALDEDGNPMTTLIPTN